MRVPGLLFDSRHLWVKVPRPAHQTIWVGYLNGGSLTPIDELGSFHPGDRLAGRRLGTSPLVGSAASLCNPGVREFALLGFRLFFRIYRQTSKMSRSGVERWPKAISCNYVALLERFRTNGTRIIFQHRLSPHLADLIVNNGQSNGWRGTQYRRLANTRPCPYRETGVRSEVDARPPSARSRFAPRLLLQLRDDNPEIQNPGKIRLFGGAREGSESFLDCIVREIHEELGYYLPPQRFELIFRWAGPGNIWLGSAAHVELFLARDVPVERLAVREGSLTIVAVDELQQLRETLAPAAEYAIKSQPRRVDTRHAIQALRSSI